MSDKSNWPVSERVKNGSKTQTIVTQVLGTDVSPFASQLSVNGVNVNTPEDILQKPPMLNFKRNATDLRRGLNGLPPIGNPKQIFSSIRVAGEDRLTHNNRFLSEKYFEDDLAGHNIKSKTNKEHAGFLAWQDFAQYRAELQRFLFGTGSERTRFPEGITPAIMQGLIPGLVINDGQPATFQTIKDSLSSDRNINSTPARAFYLASDIPLSGPSHPNASKIAYLQNGILRAFSTSSPKFQKTLHMPLNTTLTILSAKKGMSKYHSIITHNGTGPGTGGYRPQPESFVPGTPGVGANDRFIRSDDVPEQHITRDAWNLPILRFDLVPDAAGLISTYPILFHASRAPIEFLNRQYNHHFSNFSRDTRAVFSHARRGIRFTHRSRVDAFGQNDIYADQDPFFDFMAQGDHYIDSVVRAEDGAVFGGVIRGGLISQIKTRPEKLELSPVLVDHASLSSLDGVIEHFRARSSLDLSTTEIPFAAHGIKVELMSDRDPYRRVISMAEGFDLNEDHRGDYFLDDTIDFSVEAGLGVDPNTGRMITVPLQIKTQAIYPDVTPKIKPFEDVDSDVGHFLKRHAIDKKIKDILITGSLSEASITAPHVGDYSQYDVYPTQGFIYGGRTSNIDSIAFGGLLR